MNRISNITSSFKLFSNSLTAEQPTADTPTFKSSISYPFVILFLFGVVAYYHREAIQHFYDSKISNLVSKLWITTHLNSNGELESTYVPREFSLFHWVPESIHSLLIAS